MVADYTMFAEVEVCNDQKASTKYPSTILHIRKQIPKKVSWVTAVEALKDALRKEAEVTKSIRTVIEKCEDDNGDNDYHLVDYLTGEFLEEQYHGQRDLAGKISTLDKLMVQQGALAEFLFDKKLLA